MEEYEEFVKAGKIAGEALKEGIKWVREGIEYREVAEKIEEYIKAKGAMPAFPVNISVNNVAAHFTPSQSCRDVFKKGDVVKIDVGAHINGCIGDTAKTVEVGTKKYAKLIEAAEEALKAAIDSIKAGIKIGEIGEIIEEKIREYGFTPIKNLHGHSLERYKLHAGLSIPNFKNKSKVELKEGQIVAIEPFATDGLGMVVDAGLGNIYRIEKDSIMARELKKRFNGLPFAERWLYEIYGEKVPFKLSFLLKRRIIAPYFKLVEAKGGVVSQAEHTLFVTKEGCETLTEIK